MATDAGVGTGGCLRDLVVSKTRTETVTGPYNDAATPTFLTLTARFGMALRQTTGFGECLLGLKRGSPATKATVSVCAGTGAVPVSADLCNKALGGW